MLFDDIAKLAREADPNRLAETLEALAPRRETESAPATSFRRTTRRLSIGQ